MTRAEQIVCHFADYIFKYISFNENVLILIKMSKFIAKCRIDNASTLIQEMAECE